MVEITGNTVDISGTIYLRIPAMEAKLYNIREGKYFKAALTEIIPSGHEKNAEARKDG